MLSLAPLPPAGAHGTTQLFAVWCYDTLPFLPVRVRLISTSRSTYMYMYMYMYMCMYMYLYLNTNIRVHDYSALLPLCAAVCTRSWSMNWPTCIRYSELMALSRSPLFSIGKAAREMARLTTRAPGRGPSCESRVRGRNTSVAVD